MAAIRHKFTTLFSAGGVIDALRLAILILLWGLK
jgi:hypothetical protein